MKKEREENVILKKKFDEVSKEKEEIQYQMKTFMIEEKKFANLIIKEFKQTDACWNELNEYSLESLQMVLLLVETRSKRSTLILI